MKQFLWLVPLFPFFGAFLNGVVLRRRVSKQVAAFIACSMIALSFLVGMACVFDYLGSEEGKAHQAYQNVVYEWIPAGMQPVSAEGGVWRDLSISMGFQLDPLSIIMLFVVTFVGFWIHVYSIGYMHHEEGFQRFFTYLNLFMGAMLLLILGNNYLVMFVGWEGVGLCSYLLIGYYFSEEFPPFAGRKAFIVNRIGDFGFLLGLFALIATFGTLNYEKIIHAIEYDNALATGPFVLGLSVAGFVTLCLFIGAMGKSAQIPLYVWLPDAMAGPTPVSALIHAATMVTAGVYMVVRSNVLFQLAPGTSFLVACVGAATAIFAASIGMAQTDIKKVLAYSTVSQLGYMFLAAGVGAYAVAVFHLATHAFFKALLFLGSGSVIHAMSGEQDMRSMGGLRKWLPATYMTFLIGTLAIAGVPGLAGFFSKDQILASAFGSHKVLWVIGMITAGLTAFYMFRAVFMTFWGEFRGTEHQRDHLHESPKVMTIPLWILAIGAIFAGYLGIPKLGDFDKNWIVHFLDPVIAHVGDGHHGHHASLTVELILMAASVLVAGFGIWMAWSLYGRKGGLAGGERWAARFPFVHRLLENKYYVDELYDKTVVKGTWGSARGLFGFDKFIIDGLLVNGSRHLTVGLATLSGLFDRFIVDGLVNSFGVVSQFFSRTFRRLQGGLVSQYALVLVVGVFVLVFFMVVMRGIS